jgi:hypothetical protein
MMKAMLVRMIRLLGLGIFGANALSASGTGPDRPTPAEVSSERIYAKMELDGNRMDMTVAIKNVESIRASMHKYPNPARVTVYFQKGLIYIVEDNGKSKSIRQMGGDEAARQLLELIAFSPNRFLDQDDSVQLNSPIFSNYKVEIERVPKSDQDGNQKQQISEIRLENALTGIVLHRIQYLNTAPVSKKETSNRPLQFIIHNMETNERGTVRIERIEQNPGLPDFLFIRPEE